MTAGLGMFLISCSEPPAILPGSSREIAGQVLPYDESGHPTGYPGAVRFVRGALDLGALAGAPLLLDHDPRRRIGRATGTIDHPAELRARFRVAPTPVGDQALTLVAEGVRTGFSVGAVVDDYELGEPGPDGTPELIVTAAHARETSLLTFPAYASARAGLVPEPERITP